MVFLGDDYGGRERGVGAEVDTVYMVMGMFVLPSWRGKGIGKRLIQAALSGVQDARGGSDSTTSRVVVTVMMERDNHGARTLYSSCGFVVGDGAVRVKSRGEWREALAMVQDIK